jgi:hypothetical protein
VDVATFLWMFLILKIPVVAALLLVWYAIKEPAPAEGDPDSRGGGGSHHPRLRPPRGPRRGPHAEVPLPSPARVRTAARGLEVERRS